MLIARNMQVLIDNRNPLTENALIFSDKLAVKLISVTVELNKKSCKSYNTFHTYLAFNKKVIYCA